MNGEPVDPQSDRPAEDVLASLVGAIGHWQRMGWLNIPEGASFSSELLLDEARAIFRDGAA